MTYGSVQMSAAYVLPIFGRTDQPCRPAEPCKILLRLAQIGVVLFAQLAKTAKVEVPVLDEEGNPTGKTQDEQAFWHALIHGYDDKGKGWWKKYGMVFMHDDVLRRLTDKEVCVVQLFH